MAEGGVYMNRRDDTREEEIEIKEEEELYEHSEEVSLEDRVRERARCESCVREECPSPGTIDLSDEDALSEWHERVRELYGRVAVFFCFCCKMFVCAECLPKHKTPEDTDHEGMKVEREESEGMEEQRERGESDRMREEREGKRREYIENLFRNENEIERTKALFSSQAVICDRIYVKNELDQDENCLITGLCGLENKRLVVCDERNSCIKIFKLGSHVLQRYIRFVGSLRSSPCDVTEIDLKHISTKPNLVSGSGSDISATDRADPNKQCFIAVTLPEKRQIMVIDLSTNPARAQTIIKTKKKCYYIQFYDYRIFTVCREGRHSRNFVHIFSTDGDTLNNFDTGFHYDFSDPRLAVVSGRVYITDRDKVQCRNFEGQLIEDITMEVSGPRETSVDPDNNVYVYVLWQNNINKLDADLTRYMSVLDQTTDDIDRPLALCHYRDRLFISHDEVFLDNFVTVVRLL